MSGRALVAWLAALLLLAAWPVVAQQAGDEKAGGAQAPNMIEGTVSGVDWGASRVSIGGVAGFLGTEITVSPETTITGRDKQSLSLKDIRKGDVIRARYRRVGDQNVATSIAVLYSKMGSSAGAGEADQGAAQGRGTPSGR
jgi:Cu/Ag efflux protein CusF